MAGVGLEVERLGYPDIVLLQVGPHHVLLWAEACLGGLLRCWRWLDSGGQRQPSSSRHCLCLRLTSPAFRAGNSSPAGDDALPPPVPGGAALLAALRVQPAAAALRHAAAVPARDGGVGGLRPALPLSKHHHAAGRALGGVPRRCHAAARGHHAPGEPLLRPPRRQAPPLQAGEAAAGARGAAGAEAARSGCMQAGPAPCVLMLLPPGRSARVRAAHTEMLAFTPLRSHREQHEEMMAHLDAVPEPNCLVAGARREGRGGRQAGRQAVGGRTRQLLLPTAGRLVKPGAGTGGKKVPSWLVYHAPAAGDMNWIAEQGEASPLPDGWADAWLALRGAEPGNTWDPSVCTQKGRKGGSKVSRQWRCRARRRGEERRRRCSSGGPCAAPAAAPRPMLRNIRAVPPCTCCPQGRPNSPCLLSEVPKVRSPCHSHPRPAVLGRVQSRLDRLFFKLADWEPASIQLIADKVGEARRSTPNRLAGCRDARAVGWKGRGASRWPLACGTRPPSAPPCAAPPRPVPPRSSSPSQESRALFAQARRTGR